MAAPLAMCQSKHAKLILKVYPRSRRLDSQPNSSELAYLTYYASTRPGKLRKVGGFLERKSVSDLWRRRHGDVLVTIDILSALIDKCHLRLNLFAHNVVNILVMVLGCRDLVLVEHTAAMWKQFCAHHDGSIIGTDKDYAHAFEEVVQQYAELAITACHTESLRMNLVGQEAIQSITQSEALNASNSHTQLCLIVPSILQNLCYDDLQELHNLKRKLSHPGIHPAHKHHLSTVTTIDNSSMTRDIHHLAYQSLKRIFEQSSATHIRAATSSAISFLNAKKPDLDWITEIFIYAATWTGVQYRFYIITVLLSAFTNDDGKSTPNGSPKHLVAIMSSLLSSEVNMMGLAVMDVLDSVIHQVISKTLKLAANDSPSQDDEIVDVLINCISSLATHVYYHDQIIDMTTSLIDRSSLANSSPTGSVSSTTESEKKTSDTARIAGLKAVEKIFVVANSGKTSPVPRNHLQLSAWDNAVSLLTSGEHACRVAFFKTFVSYLELEYVTAAETPTDVFKTAPCATNQQAQETLTSRFLQKLVASLYECACSPSATISDYIGLHLVLSTLLDKVGFVKTIMYLPMMFKLQELQSTASCTLVAAYLRNLATSLQAEKWLASIDQEVEQRKRDRVWAEYIMFPPLSDFDIPSASDLVSSTLSNSLRLDRAAVVEEIAFHMPLFPETRREILLLDWTPSDDPASNGTNMPSNSASLHVPTGKAPRKFTLPESLPESPAVTKVNDLKDVLTRPTTARSRSRAKSSPQRPSTAVPNVPNIIFDQLNGDVSPEPYHEAKRKVDIEELLKKLEHREMQNQVSVGGVIEPPYT
ncbi:Protein EFR3 [Neolecta irregularis DAH-3]|uniref:Protein EFR3 n=1 Tax=Neolecta irregularis (strain DAH-3) TaxID=1198029 RepID=A0A1U7LL31_NEOID|nr:Protein EFR3 [Neolecta irregularis DAH-3]|eukprot:OLL23357.1 Protein EFR3 [Neolecta irregularis DAH-3]